MVARWNRTDNAALQLGNEGVISYPRRVISLNASGISCVAVCGRYYKDPVSREISKRGPDLERKDKGGKRGH